MRTDQNKHGPDIDIGVWYAALLRHSTDASGNCDAGKAARAGPKVVGIWFPPWLSAKPDARGDPRDGPAKTVCKAFEIALIETQWQKRWRSTIAEGRAGESPPEIVKELINSNIDSTARSRLPARGRLETRGIKAVFGLMLPLCPEVSEK